MLRVQLLGELQAEVDGERVAAPPGRRAWSLLGWLALHPGEIVEVKLRVEYRAGHLTLTPAVRLTVSAAPAAAPATTASAPDPSQAIIPQEFSESLGAYFDAISRQR